MNRRSFLTRLLPAVAGTVIAPTLAETLAVNAKKYFFLGGNPWIDRIPYAVANVEIHEWPGLKRHMDSTLEIDPANRFILGGPYKLLWDE